MEFSRQEYWSGLPFPYPEDLSNPGIEPRSPALQADALPSEPPGKPLKKVEIAQSRLTLCDPMDCTVHGNLQATTVEWVVFPSPGDLPNTGIEPRSHTLQADSLPAESPGKPKNTGVGTLSLLRQIFLTQDRIGVSSIAWCETKPKDLNPSKPSHF